MTQKETPGGNRAARDNDQIRPGVRWLPPGAPRSPWARPAVAHFLRLGDWLILKVRVSSLDRARDAINLVAATVDTLAGIIENDILGVKLVDGRAPTRGVVFTEDVTKIADQQDGYAGHGFLPLGIDHRLRKPFEVVH